MKATELRLDNLIYKYGTDYIGDNPCVDWNDKEIIKVDLEVLKNIQDFNGTTDYYYTDGIELTEDILLKCGFEVDKTYVSEQNPFLDYIKNELRISLPYFSFEYGDGCFNEIKYLHQLQNLYFALTNQELTINL